MTEYRMSKSTETCSMQKAPTLAKLALKKIYKYDNKKRTCENKLCKFKF